MHAETQLLVCLRCERSFQELDPDNPPLQCPNCGREAYWAVQTRTMGDIDVARDGGISVEVTYGWG